MLGSKTLLIGDSGSGKTYSIRTLIDAGLKTFVLFTENGMASVRDISCEQGLHWQYVPPTATGFSSLLESAKLLNTRDDKALAGMTTGVERNKHLAFQQMLSALSNPVCDRCGEKFPEVDSWDTSHALVIDSLSGLSLAAFQNRIGMKSLPSQGDYGVAMGSVERFVNILCVGIPCHCVLISHPEREKDEATGKIYQMPSSLGSKLSPKLPRYFDEIVYVEKDGDTFSWTNTKPGVVTKNRYLPLSGKLSPSFEPIIKEWNNQ